jgi:imidazole glycerol-phosphate synthase subunit HisH
MPSKKITIIDYGCGNILNLVRAIKFIGYEAEVTHEKNKIIDSSHIILPGVGAFGNAMKKIEKYNLHKTIWEYAGSEKPLLGICLGMQILLTESHEFGVHKGLGLIEGKVIKISNEKNIEAKVPHIGWNEIYPKKSENEWKNKILKNSLIGKNFYFVHSYVCKTKNTDSTVAVCNYSDISIPAVITSGNIFGCQFHPEKSADNGLTVLKNFCEI